MPARTSHGWRGNGVSDASPKLGGIPERVSGEAWVTGVPPTLEVWGLGILRPSYRFDATFAALGAHLPARTSHG